MVGSPFLGMPAFPFRYDFYPVAAELCFTCEILVTGLASLSRAVSALLSSWCPLSRLGLDFMYTYVPSGVQ